MAGLVAEEMMAAGAAASFGFSEVGGIAMDVEDHGTGAVAYFCIWMRGRIVEEVDEGFNGGLGSAFLGGSQDIECVEHGRVDCSAVKRESADDLLEPVSLLGIHGCCVVNFGHLDFASILWGCPLGRGIAMLLWGCVLVLVEGGGHVARHGQVDGAFVVVPLEGNATVEFTFPVTRRFVVFFESGVQVVGMLCADIFYSKIVDNQREHDGARVVFPQAMGVFGGRIPVGGKSFLQEFACEDAGLRQAVHSLLDLNVDKTIVDKWEEVVLVDDFGRYEGDRHLHVLISIEGRVQIEVLEVDGHEFCVGCGDDTVEQDLCSGDAGGFGADIARIIN